jgi:hypothetical protein
MLLYNLFDFIYLLSILAFETRLTIDSIFGFNFEIELNRRFNFRNQIKNRFDFNYFEIELNRIESILDFNIRNRIELPRILRILKIV